jgi:hypothetical protein
VQLRRLSVSLFGLVAAVAVVLTAATVWLFLTNPVPVANAVSEGDVSPFIRSIGQVIYEALSGLLKYL